MTIKSEKGCSFNHLRTISSIDNTNKNITLM